MFDPVLTQTNEMVERSSRLARLDTAGFDDHELLQSVRDVAAARCQLDAFEARVIAKIDTNGTTDSNGLQTASWVAKETQIPRHLAKSKVKVARRLQSDFPAFGEALAAGKMNWHQVEAVVKVANNRTTANFEMAQQSIVESLPVYETLESFAQDMKNLSQTADVDGGYDPSEDISRNRFDLAKDLEGALIGKLCLTEDRALRFEQAVETKTDSMYRQFVEDHNLTPELEIPGRSTIRALALEELVLLGSQVGPDGGHIGRTEALIVVRASSPLKGSTTATGTKLSDGTTRHLMCDVTVQAVVEDSLGHQIDHGREVRMFTPEQKKMLAKRDGGCSWPGCCKPINWLEAHHIEHWKRDEGPTDLVNGVLFCRYHHGVIHRKDWHAEYRGAPPEDEEGPPQPWAYVKITSPNGVVFYSNHNGKVSVYRPRRTFTKSVDEDDGTNWSGEFDLIAHWKHIEDNWSARRQHSPKEPVVTMADFREELRRRCEEEDLVA